MAAAISAGIFNDLGSGSNVDVCIIEKDSTEMLRNYEMPVRPSFLYFHRFVFSWFSFLTADTTERTTAQRPIVQVPQGNDCLAPRGRPEVYRGRGKEGTRVDR